MSMNMSLRYEVEGKGASIIKAQKIKADRVLNDELMAERMNQVKREQEISLTADWAESLEEVSNIRQHITNQKLLKDQMFYTKKALVAVRRNSLRRALEEEDILYEKELQSLGKAFYKKRT